MESPSPNPVKLLLELEPRRGAFWSSVRAALRPVRPADEADLGLWRDVFVHRRMPWYRFLQSAVFHAGALALVWMVSVAWLRQQNIVARPTFDPASLVTYSPEEYLPALDTGASESAQTQQGDPEYSKQPIISVPREADNRAQTIVAPPDIRLDRDVPLPNIVAAGHVLPAVPLEATDVTMARMVVPETVVAPAPELGAARSRTARNPLTSDVIAPPPEVALNQARGIAGPDAAVVEPPPELPNSSKSRTGPINIGSSQVIAPAPQLAVAEQHTLAARMKGGLPDGGGEPVAPPPTMNGIRGTSAGGRLIALGIHPVNPSGPVVVPGGNRRGTFAATPEGRPGASGTPDQTGTASTAARGSGKNGNGNSSATARGNSSLPSGLHVGAPDRSPVGSMAGAGGNGGSKNSPSEIREIASATPPRVGSTSHAAPVSADKVTEVDRQVFGEKRIYSMTSNTPNLNSASGSWVFRYAELKASKSSSDLSAPNARQQSDPGYPLELMRANVHGTVTLYAVIHSDGSVGDIHVLNSPDERLDAFATSALARWKFTPAVKDGKPVAVEAVVLIPFKNKRPF